MTLDEFYKRLSVQKNAQSPNLISPDFNTDEMSNTIRNIQANRNMQNNQSNVNKIISNNPNVKEVLRAPISQTVNRKVGIDVNNLQNSSNSFKDNLSSGFYGIAHLSKPIGKAMLNALNDALPYYYNARENIQNSAESFKNKDFKNGIKYALNTTRDTILAPIDYVSDTVMDFGKTKLEEKGIDNKILSGIDKLNIINEDKYNTVKTTREEIQQMVDEEYEKVTPNKILAGIAGVGSDIGVSMALNALGIPSSVTYGAISGADTYGNTDNVRKIAGDTAIGALTGAITDVTTPVIKEASKSIIPKVGQKLIPTLASNYGSNFIGGYMGSYGANTIGQQIKNMSLYLTPEQQKEINDNALSFAIFSSLLGGTKDTIKDIKISKNSLNKDVNDTIQKLQDANAQLERTDYTSNDIIKARLKARGNEIISELENKNYLLNNKNKELAVRLLRTAYDSGNVNNINYANNQVIALLGSAEMNSKISQRLTEITNQETANKIILANEKLMNSNLPDENKWEILDEATLLYERNKNVEEVVALIEKKIDNVLTNPSTNIIKGLKGSFVNYSSEKIDNTIVNNALNLVNGNNQGKRTKEQWLKVAEQIGLNSPSDKIDIYANKTWLDLMPNQKSTLNRQGKGYVPFTKEEWISTIKNANNNISNNSINEQSKISIQKVEKISNAIDKSSNVGRTSSNPLMVEQTEENDLSGATNVYYNQKNNDGDIYVLATDINGNTIYESVFLKSNIKGMYKHLGETLTNYINNNLSMDRDEVYIQSAPKKASKNDYMMSHRPSETQAYASDISNSGQTMPKDVYEHPEYYFNMNDEASKESYQIIKRIKNNPSAEVTIYRATTGDKINNGDWITLSKKYAERHNESQLDGKGNIVSMKVKAKDIQFAGDDINEFGYFPQKESSKISKIVKNESGELLTYYHGSPNGEISKFNDGSYFTTNKEYAERYMNTTASSINSGKESNKPKIYEVTLNLKKPFDINNEKEKNIFINEYVKGGNALGINPYMSDNDYKKIKTIDWTEGEDLKEWLQENYPEYDSIVLDEGGDLDENRNVKYRGNSILVFNGNDVNITNKDIKEKVAPIPKDTISKNSAPIPEKVQIKNDADNFAKQVDEYVSGNLKSGSMIRVGKTPQVLKDIGVPNRDIVLKQSKLKTILKEDNNPNSNEHGIPINTIKEIPRALSEPLNILKSSTQENSIVVVTDLADKLDRPIIVSIELDYEGQIGNIKVLNNRLTSIYGKREYDRFMNDEIEKGNLLYDIDEGIIKELPTTGLQLSKGISSRASNKAPINNIIPSEQNYVNNNENSIKNTENAPFNPEFKEKQRKRYQTVINSEVVSKEAKAIAKELMGVDTYIPESNVQQLNKADYTIEQLGAERALGSLKDKIDGGQRILAEDIAIGDRLIQYYSKTGQKQELQDAIQYTAMAGTEAGRTVQAMAMIAHQSPEGQVLWIQRFINKLNQKIASKKGGKVEVIDGKQVVTKNGKILEKVQLFEFTSDMQESILSAKSNEEMYDILDNIYEELGGQVAKNTFEKLDSWRYFSMLANPTTHIRNIVGNTAMTGTQGLKNKIAGGIEDIVAIFNKDMERTKSLVRRVDAKTAKFAKDDINNVADRLGLNQNKYSPTSRIESNKREFKSDILNNTLGKAYKLNSKALEVEDGWGLKYNYAKALSSYIASNNIDVNNITDAQLGKARNYAIAQAKEATFHQESRLASALNQIGNNNEIAKFVLDSTVPFKAVPINVAKTGLAYSPLQLVKSTTIDLVNLKNGNINLNQYIDNLSKGLTGTGIALVGYMLAQMGILKANGNDEDKEKYDEAQGKQNFSVTIGTQNFSLSWLAPTAIPLFIGAEINEILSSDKENKNNLNDENYDKALNIVKDSVDVFANAMNPMTEMSMLSGLTSVFRSYDQDNYLVGIGTNIAKSYANQYIPTALGKVARITDEYERDTTSTKSDTVSKAIDSTKNQIMSKIPVLRQMLPVKKDTWGKEVKSPTLPLRIFENTLAPYTRKDLSTDKVDRYLNSLYNKTKNKDLLPDTISKTLTFDGSTYRYTNEEYNKYKAEFGKSAHDKITKVINNKAFNKLTNDEKVDIIDEIYSDCKEEVKEKYAKVHKIEYERSDKDVEVEEEIKKGLDTSNAYIYKTIISKKESDKDRNDKAISNSSTKNKLKYIMDMEIDDSQKQHLINVSTDDTDYDVSLKDLKKLNGEYLTYLQQSGNKPEKGGMTAREEYMQLINSGIPVKQLNKYYLEKKDIEGVKNSSGKTISGSKKQAIFNYVNSLSLSIPQKQILLARENESFAKLYYNDIINYINNLNISNSEKSKMYDAIFKKIK